MWREVGKSLCIVACCVLASCATSASGPSFDAVPQTSIAADHARVYVFRAKVLYLAQAPYIARAPILLDGRTIGNLSNGGFLKVDIAAGRHSVIATAGLDQTGKIFDAPAGSEIYVEVYDKTRMEGARAAPAGLAAGAVGGAAAGAQAFVGHIAQEAQDSAAIGEGRVWGVNFVEKADALPILKGLSLSE